MKYKYLLFDADDTLLDFKTAEKNAFYKLLESKGVVPTPLLHQLYSLTNQSVWERYEKALVKKEEIGYTRYFEFIQKTGLNGEASDYNSTYHDLLGLEGGIFNGVREICEELKSRSYSVNIVTNGFADTQKSRLSRSGILPFIDNLFISEELGVQKPEKLFFDKVFETIGCNDKSQYLIIGDSLTSDILGGKNAGIDTCWFNSRLKENKTDIKPTYYIESLSELFDII